MEIRKIQPQWVNEFMTAEIIDGKRIANTVKDEVAAAVLQRTAAGFPPPGLATVLVGNDPPSHIHVRNKTKTCEKLGIRSFSHLLPEDTTQEVLENLIGQLNSNPDVHGILFQLPLPEFTRSMQACFPEKRVHPGLSHVRLPVFFISSIPLNQTSPDWKPS